MSLFDDHHVTRGQYACPWCDEANNAAFSPSEPTASPKPGDVGICARCAKPMIYQGFGKPRRPTEAEWAEINADEHINALRREMFMLGARHGRVEYQEIEVRTREDE